MNWFYRATLMGYRDEFISENGRDLMHYDNAMRKVYAILDNEGIPRTMFSHLATPKNYGDTMYICLTNGVHIETDKLRKVKKVMNYGSN